MFAHRYFAARYFTPRYWPPAVGVVVVVDNRFYLSIGRGFIAGSVSGGGFVAGAEALTGFGAGGVQGGGFVAGADQLTTFGAGMQKGKGES